MLAVFGCGGTGGSGEQAASAPGASGTSWSAWDAGLERAKAERRYVVVDVYTDWCGWCKRMDAEVYANADVSGYLAQKFVSIKLDAEGDAPLRHKGHALTSSQLAQAFGVTGYPTTLFLTPDGDLVTSIPGYLPRERFLLVLRYIGDGHLDRGVSFEDYEAQAARS